MTFDDIYEGVLLVAAVRALDGRTHYLRIWPPDDADGWHLTIFESTTDNGVDVYEGATLTDALLALLADLGVKAPEPPSAERTAKTRAEFIRECGGDSEPIDTLAAWALDDPLDVLSLILPARPAEEVGVDD